MPTSSALVLAAHTTTSCFLYGFWGLNSGPHADHVGPHSSVLLQCLWCQGILASCCRCKNSQNAYRGFLGLKHLHLAVPLGKIEMLPAEPQQRRQCLSSCFSEDSMTLMHMNCIGGGLAVYRTEAEGLDEGKLLLRTLAASSW